MQIAQAITEDSQLKAVLTWSVSAVRNFCWKNLTLNHLWTLPKVPVCIWAGQAETAVGRCSLLSLGVRLLLPCQKKFECFWVALLLHHLSARIGNREVRWRNYQGRRHSSADLEHGTKPLTENSSNHFPLQLSWSSEAYEYARNYTFCYWGTDCWSKAWGGGSWGSVMCQNATAISAVH